MRHAQIAAPPSSAPRATQAGWTSSSPKTDLVAYGCPLVLFKLDKFGDAPELLLEDVMAGPPPQAPHDPNDANAMCDVDELDDDEDGIAVVGGARGKRKGGTGAGAARSKAGGGAKGPLNFIGWKHEQFLELCVLSGCDFSPTSAASASKRRARPRRQAPVRRRPRAPRRQEDPRAARARRRLQAPSTFRHARVYDPALRRLRPLNPMPEELEPHDGGVDTAFLRSRGG